MGVAAWVRGLRRPKSARQTADVAKFCLQCLQVTQGSAVESGALFMRYCAHAAEMGASGLPRADFDVALAAFCKATGLRIRRHGLKAHVEDVKLAA